MIGMSFLVDKPKVTLQDYDKYSYPLRELGWDIDEIINPVIFSQKEWDENRFTLFNHNVRREGIAINIQDRSAQF